MHGLDLFSGIGGISLALKEYVKPVAYCEIDGFCRRVLHKQFANQNLWRAPIWDDVKTLNASDIKEDIDIIYGGFPCQDISIAGLGKGLEGERSGLFFEIMRLAKQIKPKFLFLENVPAITTRGGLRVVKEIASMGYDCRWCVISAASVGALHKRERWFLLGYSNSFTSKQADSNPITLTCEEATRRRSSRQYWPYESRAHWQEVVSSVRRVTDGVPYGLDRLRALGNAVVPQQTLAAFELLLGINNGS